VTLTDLIPALGRPKPRKANRAETKLRKVEDQLAAVRQDNVKLLTRQAAADDYFALLIQDRDQVYGAWQFAEQKRQDAETVAVCALEESARLTAELTWWREKFGQQVADEANAHAVDVPPAIRPISGPEDEATGPIDVRDLRARFAGGPVVSLHHSPQAVRPDHIPSWAETTPLPVVDETQGVAS